MLDKTNEERRQDRGDGGGGRDDDVFVQYMMEKARYDLLYVASRIAEITTRYFQFRVRDMMARGFPFHHSYDMRIDGNRVIVTLEIEVPDELVERYARHYGFLARLVKHISRNYRRADRYTTRAGIFEDLEAESGEPDIELEVETPAAGAAGGGAEDNRAEEAAGPAKAAGAGGGAEAGGPGLHRPRKGGGGGGVGP